MKTINRLCDLTILPLWFGGALAVAAAGNVFMAGLMGFLGVLAAVRVGPAIMARLSGR